MNDLNQLEKEQLLLLVKDILEKEGYKVANFHNNQPLEKSFDIIPFPKNRKVEENLNESDIRSLKYDSNITTINKTVTLYGIEKSELGISGYLNVENITEQFIFPLIPLETDFFLKNYEKKKNILCNAQITYSPDLNVLCLHYLRIYKHDNPFKEWTQLMINKSLKDRVKIILDILGLNQNTLLYQEQIVQIQRLIPLIVKKYLYVEVSKKELGKTFSYTSLGFIPYTLLLTRTSMFIDGRNGKSGDFFAEDNSFIIDEISKINDPDIISAIQVYMNNAEKGIGSIQTTGNSIKKSSISPIILGNAKKTFDFSMIFAEKINLFDNTIIMDNDNGAAFVSRINCLSPSWGCRPFNKNMQNTQEIDFYNLSLLKEVIPILREKEVTLNTDSFFSNLNIRCAESIEKTLEGWIKLLYPEYIDNPTLIPEQEYNFIMDRSIETRITVENQLSILEKTDKRSQLRPRSDLKPLILDLKGAYFCTPHRVFINNGCNITKIPLDTIGIEQNEVEAKKIKDQCKYENNILIHSVNLTNNVFNFNTWNYTNLDSNKFNKLSYNYNYLIGTYEESNEILYPYVFYL